MKHLFLLVLLFILHPVMGQSFSQDLNLGKFSMPIGAYYYPEQWDENQWDRDLKHMSDLGFEFTHFAEFAWSRLEPKDGNFDFSWLDENISLAGKYGLKVVLCTPSATPPAWLTAKHPEILIKLESEFTVKHGMRLNCNGSNPIYQKYINRLVSKMAERYGNNPIVAGWQIDNEPHFEGLYDYSDFSQNAFRKWLKTKYQSIEKLNQSWGASFWSFTYNNFNQIFIPNKNEHAGNQHALLDFKSYTADALAEAVRFQTTVLRNSVSKNQWVTTNFAYYKFLPSVDLFRNQKDLDFASHTMYLLSTFLNTDKGEMAYRLGSGMELSFSGEMARSIKGFTGIMELQPGQINWGQWNSQPLPGAVRMWIWHCFGLGDKFVCTYRFRQPLFGGEQFHKGIVEPDGLTVSPGGKEFVQTIAEIGKLKINNSQAIEIPHEIQTRTTAFLWKQENLLALEDTKGTNSWNTWAHYYTYYQCLKSMGCPVVFIQETDSFDVQKYPFMIAPAFEMLDKNLIDKWTKYVADGGHLVLTTRTGMKNKNGHLWETLLQQPIWNLIGAKIDFFDQLPPTITSNVEFSDKKYGWNVWGDVLTPTQNTEVWSTHTDNFYNGKAAVVNHKQVKGSVMYVGIVSTDGEFEKALLRKFYLQSGAQILHLPDYVFVEWRNGFWVAVNYSSKQFELPILNENEIILGDKILSPGGVTVWK